MRKVFVDWAISKKITYTFLDEDKVHSGTWDDILPGCEVYMEEGCPLQFLIGLLEKGCKIYTIFNPTVNKYRKEYGFVKSDEQDPLLLKKIYLEHPEEFKPFRYDLFKLKLRYYGRLLRFYIRARASIINRTRAFERHYGSTGLEMVMQVLSDKIRETERRLEELLREELTALEKTKPKGVNHRLLIRLLAEAHPAFFSSLSRYLSYCGYKAHARESKKYNREAHTVAWFMARETIMHRDPKYYPLYKKIKEEKLREHPDWSRARANAVAINRIATFLLKWAYNTCRGIGKRGEKQRKVYW